MKSIDITTAGRDQMIDLTARVQEIVSRSGIKSGLCVIFVPHTTAGITVNENTDPDVIRDILTSLDKQVPWQDGYRHNEGNSAAHIKASLVGSSVTVIVEEGRLQLGTWQAIFLAEFDGPRKRKVFVRVVS